MSAAEEPDTTLAKVRETVGGDTIVGIFKEWKHFILKKKYERLVEKYEEKERILAAKQLEIN